MIEHVVCLGLMSLGLAGGRWWGRLKPRIEIQTVEVEKTVEVQVPVEVRVDVPYKVEVPTELLVYQDPETVYVYVPVEVPMGPDAEAQIVEPEEGYVSLVLMSPLGYIESLQSARSAPPFVTKNHGKNASIRYDLLSQDGRVYWYQRNA